MCAGYVRHLQDIIQSLFDMGLQWVGLSVEIARSCGVTVYDALFVATAEALGVDFITADERLAGRLPPNAPVRFLGSL